jgi:hypothetical protein
MSQTQRVPASTSRTGSLAGSPPSAFEYAIIAVLITAVAVGTWKTFGEPPDPDAPVTGAAR